MGRDIPATRDHQGGGEDGVGRAHGKHPGDPVAARPGAPPTQWDDPNLQTAKDKVIRALDSSRQGLPKISSKDFCHSEHDQDPEDRRSAGEHQEGGTRANQGQDNPPELRGTSLPPPCTSSSRTITAKNQDKASATDVAKILRCGTELIKNLEAAGRHQKTEAAKVAGEGILTYSSREQDPQQHRARGAHQAQGTDGAHHDQGKARDAHQEQNP